MYTAVSLPPSHRAKPRPPTRFGIDLIVPLAASLIGLVLLSVGVATRARRDRSN